MLLGGNSVCNGGGANNGGNLDLDNNDENGRCSPLLPPAPTKYLLSDPHYQDGNKKCMVIDLDETLVHSSFKVRPVVWLRLAPCPAFERSQLIQQLFNLSGSLSFGYSLTAYFHFLANKQCGFHSTGGNRRHCSPSVRAQEAPRR